MATYHIHINERMTLGKSLISLLKLAPEVVTFEPTVKKQATPQKSELYKSLESAFKDVREIMDGKQKKQTLREFLNEL